MDLLAFLMRLGSRQEGTRNLDIEWKKKNDSLYDLIQLIR
jgi:hypothetical protein